jgi:Fe-S cluster assembly iron-binding protein IscA
VLTISPTASDAIRQLVDAASLPESAGIRIAQGEQTPEGTAVELALVDAPAEDDQVVSGEGASVFVDGQIAALLEDKVLDAQVSDGQVAFALREDAAPGFEPSENGRP